ncbi:transport and Golgi organization protein 11 [Cryptotermes secundus]|nr:transport and Golgi organization protein 11 [Cryptotermes secundus]XP_023711887.1 transport and Golgi organization protein 11 [Cryptotermes secundus]XP_023711888.1 transport and Golgi organization protein 11 [Cryptotermes secundus]XP_023711889.1 transport and Golgi organization protein 11 [Cryptotermes secundus]
MSKAASPTRFSGELDHFYDPNFTADISQKMRVPKRIRVDGESDDDQNTGSNWNAMLANEKFDMHVPDRILVAGQEQHIGTKAPPRELILENAAMPPDPGMVRVQTPPRVITLDEHYFPSADDFPSHTAQPEEMLTMAVMKPKPYFYTEQRLVRESTPPVGTGEGLTPSEELVHLRRQMAKLNRRVMAMELDNMQRQQREKIICAIGLAYFFFKVAFWLARSS